MKKDRTFVQAGFIPTDDGKYIPCVKITDLETNESYLQKLPDMLSNSKEEAQEAANRFVRFALDNNPTVTFHKRSEEH